MAIAIKKTVPISEGGNVLSSSLSTAEGAQLTSEKPKPSISVRQPLLSEILTKVHKAKLYDDKLRILKEEDCLALRQICQWSFNPNIVSELPPGDPPYIENDAPEGTEHTILRTESNGLWHFVKTNGKSADPNIQQTVRERMFIRLLEGLHKDEAKLLCLVKEKKLHRDKEGGYKGLSAKVVKDAFGWNEDFQEYK
jgi:hypothetical protein|tara:strand:+ start:46 stop:633 length:588 start_codon:yes stop_codon:yes gene_type:complete